MTYWKAKTLEELTDEEWEGLCDGCGRCCLQKLECEDSGDIFYTNLTCKQLDTESCRCKDYTNRTKIVSACMSLRQLNDEDWYFMPTTCAYRLIKEGKALKDWHPLIFGSDEKMIAEGISIKGQLTISEADVAEEDFEEHVIQWVEC